MTTAKIRLQEIDLVVGEPLGYDVYDSRDRLLLNRGHVLGSLDQIERLLERGAYGIRPEVEAWRRARGHAATPEIETSESVDVSLFAWAESIQGRLAGLLDAPPANGKFQRSVVELAESVQKFVDTDTDAAIASILVSRDQRYSVRHAFNVALLSDIVGRHRLADPQRRLPMVCAAFTMNITIMSLQDALYAQKETLSPEQRAAIIGHPMQGVSRLRELGVTDSNWLDAVGAHHESLDGKGYPNRLEGSAIGMDAQTVGICDQYCALVSERATRNGVLPSIALRKLFLERQPFDTTLAAILVKEIGIYPPGALVRLANDDLAIVIRRTRNAHTPIVRGLVSATRRILNGFPKRQTSKAAFAIAEVLDTSKMPALRDANDKPVAPSSLWHDAAADAKDVWDITDDTELALHTR